MSPTLRLLVASAAVVALAAPPVRAQCASGARASVRTFGCECADGCVDLLGDALDVDLTPDGRFVVFASRDPAGNFQIFRHDRDGDRDGVFEPSDGQQTMQLTWSLTGSSRAPRVSDDGNTIVFESTATDIIEGSVDQNGTVSDIYRIDLVPVICGVSLANRSRVSVSDAGCQTDQPSFRPSVSGDGVRVSFLTAGALDAADTNGLVDLYVRTHFAVPCTQVSLQCAPPPAPPVVGVCDGRLDLASYGVASASPSAVAGVLDGELSPDGRFVLFASAAPDLDRPGADTNGAPDVFLRELQAGRTVRVTTNEAPGERASATRLIGSLGSVLGDGSMLGMIAYQEPGGAGPLSVVDVRTGAVRWRSAPGLAAERPRIARDNRFVAFYRGGAVWLYDLVLGAETLVDCGNGATLPLGLDLSPPALTADGGEVAFASSSEGLVAGDTNGLQDAFVVTPELVLDSPFCDGGDGALAQCPCTNPGAADAGCENADGTGGVALHVVAQTQRPTPSLTLSGTGFPLGGRPAAVVLRSRTVAPAGPTVFQDGVLCLETPFDALGGAQAAGGVSEHTLDHTAGAGVFHYQLWYRSRPAAFCDPFAASNLSNGQRVVWQ